MLLSVSLVQYELLHLAQLHCVIHVSNYNMFSEFKEGVFVDNMGFHPSRVALL